MRGVRVHAGWQAVDNCSENNARGVLRVFPPTQWDFTRLAGRRSISPEESEDESESDAPVIAVATESRVDTCWPLSVRPKEPATSKRALS